MEGKRRNRIRHAAIFILQIAVSTILYFILLILMNGMWLWGIPREEDVESVSISYPSLTETVKSYDEEDKISLSVSLSNFLKYVPFKKADTSEQPLITIVYKTTDGKTLSISANDETVWWKDKAYALKDDETFINLAEGIFFSEFIQ